MKKRWVIKKPITEEFIKKFPDINPVILQLLYNRKIKTKEQIKEYLNPKFESLSSPFHLSGMKEAVERIYQAIVGDEKTVIYADYDADAVTAAAILYRAMKKLGARNLGVYIPDRFTEGYGINQEAIRQLATSGAKLIISVDCGINAISEAETAKNLGLDIIITDHHEITGKLPEAVAVINPKKDNFERLHNLTGVGVAFKLVQALFFTQSPESYEKFDWVNSDRLNINFKQISNKLSLAHWEKWLLDLVAVGTVADCQNLLGENRVLVKYGLKVLAKTRWMGMRELLRNAGIDEYQNFDTYTLSFIIAPRINAAGRIQHADIAFRLLVSDDPKEARIYSGQIESLNTHRQRLTEQIFSDAKSQVELQSESKILIAVGQNWPRGIVGLVASKLTEEFHKPTIILERGEVFATGSARSIESFNIFEAFTSGRTHLEKFGGHAGAAGLTIKNNKIGEFHRFLLDFAETRISEKDLLKEETVDAIIEPELIDQNFLEMVKKFEPFGLGNPPVRFIIQKISVESMQSVGATGRHVRIIGSKNGKIYKFIGFGKGYLLRYLGSGNLVDIIIEPSENEWNGRKELQLKIIDLIKNR